MSAATRARTPEERRQLTGAPSSEAMVESLLAHLAERVAEAVAPKLAALLAEHVEVQAEVPLTRRLVTLDELVAELPAGKSQVTWKRWLYERTRHGQVPGCHKLGGRLFFDPEHTIPWLTGTRADGVDVFAEQSLHEPMPSQDHVGGG